MHEELPQFSLVHEELFREGTLCLNRQMSKRIKKYQLAPNEMVYTCRRECLALAYRDGERQPVHHVTTYHSTKVNRDGKQICPGNNPQVLHATYKPATGTAHFHYFSYHSNHKAGRASRGKFGPLWSQKLKIAFHQSSGQLFSWWANL